MFKNKKLSFRIYSSYVIVFAFMIFMGVVAIADMYDTDGRITLPILIVLISMAAAVILGIITVNSVVKNITASMNVIIEKIRQGGEQVVAASSQLSTTSQQLAEANAEQASSIQEISATIEETTSMIQQNSENTKQADMLADQVKRAADECNTDMTEMMSSMDGIKKSSGQISKIIKVIDDIAFQTNILALNAAVEAARAGEAGMGFAVVAEEVRNLAQRSAKAAKDTEEMIENNIELSGKGYEVAVKVTSSIAEITTQVKKVSELMDEITAASQEQTQGAVQINKAILQIDNVTEENAAIAEESAAASQELNAQAETTEEMMEELSFLINGGKKVRVSSRANIPASKSYPRSTAGEGKSVTKKAKLKSPNEIIPLEEDNADF